MTDKTGAGRSSGREGTGTVRTMSLAMAMALALALASCSGTPAVKTATRVTAVPAPVSAGTAPAAAGAVDMTEALQLVAELNGKLAAFPQAAATAATPNAVLLKIPAHLLFLADAQTLSPDGVGILATLAAALRSHGTANCEVAVYTDALGGELDNETLARRRAEALVAQLVLAGVPSPRLQASGMGAAKAVAPNDSPEGRRQNRRVEVTIRLAGNRAAS